MSGELADRTCRECGQPVFDHEETRLFGLDRQNELHIWATERAIQQIDNAAVDHVLRFLFLDTLIADEAFEKVEHGDATMYKPRTLRWVCEIPEKETAITLVVAGRTHRDNGNIRIVRDVYVRIESLRELDIGEWQFCIASLFSFIFSCRVPAGLQFNMAEDWKDVTVRLPPYYQTGIPKEIAETSRRYAVVYKSMIHAFESVCEKWVQFYFRNGAYRWGLHKYLATVNHETKMVAEADIAFVCEAFEHCATSDGMSCEDAISSALRKLLQYENRDIEDGSNTLKTLVRFYQNGKHYQNNDSNPRKDKSFAVAMPSDRRIALLYFAKRLFQLSLLHDLLEDNADVFDHAYSHLCKDANHLVGIREGVGPLALIPHHPLLPQAHRRCGRRQFALQFIG